MLSLGHFEVTKTISSWTSLKPIRCQVSPLHLFWVFAQKLAWAPSSRRAIPQLVNSPYGIYSINSTLHSPQLALAFALYDFFQRITQYLYSEPHSLLSHLSSVAYAQGEPLKLRLSTIWVGNFWALPRNWQWSCKIWFYSYSELPLSPPNFRSNIN